MRRKVQIAYSTVVLRPAKPLVIICKIMFHGGVEGRRWGRSSTYMCTYIYKLDLKLQTVNNESLPLCRPRNRHTLTLSNKARRDTWTVLVPSSRNNAKPSNQTIRFWAFYPDTIIQKRALLRASFAWTSATEGIRAGHPPHKDGSMANLQ